jgi:hypothetical protein
MTIDTAQALEHAQRGIALDRALVKQYPGDPTLEQALGAITAAAAGALCNLGELEKAGEYYRESIASRERLLEAHPTNPLIRRNLMNAYGNYEVPESARGGPRLWPQVCCVSSCRGERRSQRRYGQA